MVQLKAGEDRDISIPDRVTMSGDAVTISGNSVIAKTSGQTINVRITDVAGNPVVDVDSGLGALNVIDVIHREVHKGQLYTAAHFDSDSDTTSGTIVWATYPGSGEYHTNIGVTADGAGLVELWETNAVSGGTSLYAYNNKRFSTNSSLVNFKYSPSSYTSGNGTRLWAGFIGADNNKTKIGGEAKNGAEWIFQSGNALVVYYPDGDNQKCTVQFEYYEVL